MSILSPLLFCEPQQLLTFLTILGAISGAFTVAYEKKLFKKKTSFYISYFFIVFAYLLYLLAFITAYTSNLIILFFTLFYFSLIAVLIIKGKSIFIKIILLVLIAYFISGITGNACLYLPIQKEGTTFEFQTVDVYLWVGDSISLRFNQPNFLKEILNCNAQGFTLKNITNGGALVDIYDNFSQVPIHETWIEENQELTICPNQETLVKVYNDVTEWHLIVRDDIFSNIQDWFTVRGYYKNP
jgi:hypothetical protein